MANEEKTDIDPTALNIVQNEDGSVQIKDIHITKQEIDIFENEAVYRAYLAKRLESLDWKIWNVMKMLEKYDE